MTGLQQVMEVEVGVDARSRRVRIKRCKADRLTACSIGCYRAVDGTLWIEETIKGGLCDVVGDGALVEGIVLAPEVLACLFVGGLDGADLDG